MDRYELLGETSLARRRLRATDLVALARDDFVGAVTGHAPAAQAADEVVTARIAGLTRPALRRV